MVEALVHSDVSDIKDMAWPADGERGAIGSATNRLRLDIEPVPAVAAIIDKSW